MDGVAIPNVGAHLPQSLHRFVMTLVIEIQQMQCL